MAPLTAAEITALLSTNLATVFSNRDPATRLAAVQSLYSPTCAFHGPDPNKIVVGHEQLSEHAGALLEKAPASWGFHPKGTSYVAADMGMQAWEFGPEGEAKQRGWDLVRIGEGGKIQVLYVFIEGVSNK